MDLEADCLLRIEHFVCLYIILIGRKVANQGIERKSLRFTVEG